MRIGLLTWHYYENFGSKLQTVASVLTLEKLGHKVSLINYRNKLFGANSKKTDIFLRITNKLPYRIIGMLPIKARKSGRRFDLNFFKETNVLYEVDQLNALATSFDAVICGSDQIWAPNVFNPIYMLNFVSKGVKKISYAASIGLDYIPEELVREYKKYIGRMDYVSVRESQGKNVLKQQCDIESKVVLDPTLLVDIKDWKKIEIRTNIRKPYIFCYFLKIDHQYKESVKRYA